jgi:hypothetical protein
MLLRLAVSFRMLRRYESDRALVRHFKLIQAYDDLLFLESTYLKGENECVTY